MPSEAKLRNGNPLKIVNAAVGGLIVPAAFNIPIVLATVAEELEFTNASVAIAL